MKWEYKSYSFKRRIGDIFGGKSSDDYFTEALNSFGDDGWELVQILYDDRDRIISAEHYAIFKRPKA